jgi:catechol 2,3-dioxygenase-like lactoylglutathione lyase family enzyme
MSDFKINFLDHVAIRVKDLALSAEWYEKVLGLKKYEIDAWGAYPIFMLSGKTGVALFPANTSDPKLEAFSKNVKIDHFAFNVSQGDFKKARAKYDALEVKYTFQDHTYFHSLYTKDPDGHTVELTTLVVDADEFYGKL